jgi:hypothetical protein
MSGVPSFSAEYYPLYEPVTGCDGRLYWSAFVDGEKDWVLVPNQKTQRTRQRKKNSGPPSISANCYNVGDIVDGTGGHQYIVVEENGENTYEIYQISYSSGVGVKYVSVSDDQLENCMSSMNIQSTDAPKKRRGRKRNNN